MLLNPYWFFKLPILDAQGAMNAQAGALAGAGLVAASGGPSSLLTSLISYWKLDEASGTAFDAHSTNHLTDVNAVGTMGGKILGAREFVTTSSKYLTINNNASLQINTSFTMSAWVKFTDRIGSRTIVAKGAEYNLEFYASKSRLSFRMNGLDVSATSAPEAGVWYFVVGWYDSSLAQPNSFIQINGGTPVAGNMGTPAIGTNPFRIGAAGTLATPSQYLNGIVDEVGLWRRALSPAERTTLYSLGTGKAYPFDAPEYVPSSLLTNLVLYWNLDEVTTGTALPTHGDLPLPQVNNPASVPGKVGNAREIEKDAGQAFTRTSTVLQVGGDIAFSWAVWVKLESLTAGVWNPILAKSGETTVREYMVYLEGATADAIRFKGWISPNGTQASTVIVTAESLGVPVLGVWYFVVFWHDPAADKIYLQINDGPVDEASVSGGAFATTTEFYVGTLAGSGIHRMDGVVDEIGFWKKALTAEDRTTLYNGGAGKAYPFT